MFLKVNNLLKIISLIFITSFLMSAKSCGYDPKGLTPTLVNLNANVAYKYTIIEGKPEIKVNNPEKVRLETLNGWYCLPPDQVTELRREWESNN